MTRTQAQDYLMDTGYSREEATFEAICRTGVDLDEEQPEPKTGSYYMSNIYRASNRLAEREW